MDSPPDCEVLTDEDLQKRKRVREDQTKRILWDFVQHQKRFDKQTLETTSTTEMADEARKMFFEVAHKALELDKLKAKRDIYRYQADS